MLPLLPEPVAAMVELQLLTGMRPGEVVLMRMSDVDRSGDVWLYTPEEHKNAWRGKERKVYLGPKAQEILRRFRLVEVVGEPVRVRSCFVKGYSELPVRVHAW